MLAGRNIAVAIVLGLTLALAVVPGSDAASTGYIFDVGPNVPEAQVALIKNAFAIADDYLDRVYGGGIPAEAQGKITVRIVATGMGNQDPGGGGACCTGLGESGFSPFFDVLHPDWAQSTAGRGWTTETDEMKNAIHEYAHGWQASLGAMTLHSQPLGDWIDEGIAEYIAYGALVDKGLIKQADADRMEFTSAVGPELYEPLKDFAGTGGPTWPGHVGYIAIQWLVAESPNGPRSLRILANQIRIGRSAEAAFTAAFDIAPDDFYAQFADWAKTIPIKPAAALANRPELLNIGESKSADELFQLGYDSETGTGMPKSDANAFKWYLLAAEKGQVEAERNLAGMYGSGRGVASNPAEAKRWFRAAADAGDAQAQYVLGRWYSDGSDDTIKWFRLAAAQGHAEAIAGLKNLGVSLAEAAPPAATPPAPKPAEAAAAAPVRSSWTWNQPEGQCNVVGVPIGAAPDSKTRIIVFNGLIKGDPNYFVAVGGAAVADVQVHVIVDGVVYPAIKVKTGEGAVLYVRSVSSKGKILGNDPGAVRIADSALLQAMSRGKLLDVRTILRQGPDKGKVFTDHYDLAGFAAAKAAADISCNAQPLAIACVQNEFSALGFNAGKPTGRLDDKARRAAAAYLGKFGSKLGDGSDIKPLDEKWATEWCLELAKLHPDLEPIAQPVVDTESIRFGVNASGSTTLPTISFVANGATLATLAPDALTAEQAGDATVMLGTVPYAQVADMDNVCFHTPAGWIIVDRGGGRHGDTLCAPFRAGFLAAELRDWLTLQIVKE